MKRSEVPLEATWKRETTFASWEAWDRRFEKVLRDLPTCGEELLGRSD